MNSYPVIKSDAMRYISTFRQQVHKLIQFILLYELYKIKILHFKLPKEVILNIISNLIRFLTSNVPVVHTYACHAIERILTLKAPSNKENL